MITIEQKNGNVYMESDGNQWVIFDGFSITEKDGKEHKTRFNPKYYSNITMALNGLLEIGIRKTEAETIKELISEIKAMKRKIYELVQIGGVE